MEKALIIDESITMRKTLVGYLSPTFVCTDCRSLDSALELLHDNQFSLIITEIHFGGILQQDITNRLHELQPAAHILVISASPTPELVYAVQRSAASGLLVKPLTAKILYNRINSAFSSPVMTLQGSLTQLSELTVKIHRRGAYTVLSLAGKLVSSTCSLLRSHIHEVIRKGARKIALDLEKISTIDTAALGFLQKSCQELKTLAVDFCLFNTVKILDKISDQLGLLQNMALFRDSAEFETALVREPGRMAFPRLLRVGSNLL